MLFFEKRFSRISGDARLRQACSVLNKIKIKDSRFFTQSWFLRTLGTFQALEAKQKSELRESRTVSKVLRLGCDTEKFQNNMDIKVLGCLPK